MSKHEAIAALNRALATFSLSAPGIRSSGIRDALGSIEALREEISDRSFVKSLRNLNRELAAFSLLEPLLEIKKSPAGLQVSGHASTFGPPPDLQNDIVDKGAFNASLERHRWAGTTPIMLFGHNQNKPIGTWTRLVADDRGLLVTGIILSTVRKGREAIALLEAKSINGLSIGFRCKRDKIAGRIRHIQEADLIEISLCAVPAASTARLAIVGEGF